MHLVKPGKGAQGNPDLLPDKRRIESTLRMMPAAHLALFAQLFGNGHTVFSKLKISIRDHTQAYRIVDQVFIEVLSTPRENTVRRAYQLEEALILFTDLGLVSEVARAVYSDLQYSRGVGDMACYHITPEKEPLLYRYLLDTRGGQAVYMPEPLFMVELSSATEQILSAHIGQALPQREYTLSFSSTRRTFELTSYGHVFGHKLVAEYS